MRLFLSLLILLFLIPVTFAGNQTSQTSEEEGCFDILRQYTKSQYGADLDNYLEKPLTYPYFMNLIKGIDKSYYSNSLNHVKINGNTLDIYPSSPNGLNARRNNIGTIILDWKYINTHYITFGYKTNFQFPTPDDDSNGLGAQYPQFFNRVVYTHHLRETGDFVSCGYLRLKPAGVSESDETSYKNALRQRMNSDTYLTNVIQNGMPGNGGFELLRDANNPEVRDGNQYIVGKVLVSAVDVEKKPLFNIELVTVAWNNKSRFFNEYETFPLQVKAMTNPDTYSDINRIQENFLKSVRDETCLYYLHDYYNYPSKCGGSSKSLSFSEGYKSPLERLSTFLIPSVQAKLDISEIDQQDVSTGTHNGKIYVNSTVTLDTMEKLEKIDNENFKTYFRFAVAPSSMSMLKAKQSSGVVLNPFEQAFLDCPLTYQERLQLLTSWLESIEPQKFDINSIEYPDPRIGDCVLPYPDKRHKNQVIPGAFPSNQLYAQVITNTFTGKVYDPNSSSDQGKTGVKSNTVMYTIFSWQNIMGAVLICIGAIIIFILFRKQNYATQNQEKK